MSGVWDYLVGTGGVLWIAAQMAEFAALIAESAGGAKSPDGEMLKRPTAAKLFLAVAALLTPGLLYAHGYVAWVQTTAAEEDPLLTFVTTLGSLSVLFVVFGGGILGWLLGLVVKPVRRFMHTAVLPLAALALGLAFVSALPSLPLLIESVAQRLN